MVRNPTERRGVAARLALATALGLVGALELATPAPALEQTLSGAAIGNLGKLSQHKPLAIGRYKLTATPTGTEGKARTPTFRIVR